MECGISKSDTTGRTLNPSDALLYQGRAGVVKASGVVFASMAAFFLYYYNDGMGVLSNRARRGSRIDAGSEDG